MHSRCAFIADEWNIASIKIHGIHGFRLRFSQLFPTFPDSVAVRRSPGDVIDLHGQAMKDEQKRCDEAFR